MVGPDPINPYARALIHELRAHGYVEGRNLSLELRSAEGKFDRFPSIFADLVATKVDVLVTTFNGMTAEAKKATSTIPIVMAGSNHPVEAGLIASLASPGGNVTGVSSDAGPENEGKRLELLSEAIPKATKVAFLGMKTDWEGEIGQTLRQVGQSLRIDLLHAEHTPTDYGRGRTARRSSSGPRSWRRVSRASPRHHGPTPVSKLARTARALGLTIPPSLLLRADQVVE